MFKGKTTNYVHLRGTVLCAPELNHQANNVKWYKFYMSVLRRSGTEDRLPIFIPEKFVEDVHCLDVIEVFGEYHSWNDRKTGRLLLRVIANEVITSSDRSCFEEDINQVKFKGCIYKIGKVRDTPKGCKILDMIICVQREDNTNSYIPCVFWGNTAERASDANVGQKVSIVGRIQSRKYKKKYEDGTSQTKTAYEVSSYRYTRL